MDKEIKIYTDGGARGNPGPAAAAFIVVEEERVIYKNSKFLGVATNNIAEYEAVLLALKWLLKTKEISRTQVIFFLDSELVVKQLNGFYKIKSTHLKTLASQVKRLEKKLGKKVFYKSVKREKNILADRLVNQEIDEKLADFTL